MTHKYDFLVVGSGIAGMSFALKVAAHGKVAIITKNQLEDTNTFHAQGGIATVSQIVDNFDKHISDTCIAGAGLCNHDVVTKVVSEAPQQIEELVAWGVSFDRNEKGDFDLHKEGGHSESRILHHKDSTGAEIQTSLIRAIKKHPNIDIFDHHFAIEILTQHHLGEIVTGCTPNIACYGAFVLNQKTNAIEKFLSRITMMATGGIGSIYQTTTNPLVATGDGVAMVARAKGVIKDMEFVQFHPTAFFHPHERPSFLITEALRGYGGILRTMDGEDFMKRYDKRQSLAPRDIVARAIDSEMKNRGHDHVYLDITHKNGEETKNSFPAIYKKCLSHGIDITQDYIPVAPAAHYSCGGIEVNIHAQTSINHLYASGECACTGLHGANRLASNSLIEAVVYADAGAKHALTIFKEINFEENIPAWDAAGTTLPEEMVLITQTEKEVAQIMSSYVGIVRSNLRLQRAMTRLNILYRETEHLFNQSVVSRDICELRNIIKVSYEVIKHAMQRKESRGLHYNIDYPANNKKAKQIQQ